MASSNNLITKESTTMETKTKEMSTKRAAYISLAILAPFLLIAYGPQILQIGITGGAAFAVLFLLVKNHKAILEQLKQWQKSFLELVNHKENEKDE